MSTRLARTVAVIALVVGPLSLIVGNVLQWLLQPAGAAPTATDVAAQFPTAWLALGLLSVLGPLVWLGGLPAVTALATERGRLLTWIGGLVTGAGLAAGIGHLAEFFGAYGAIAAAGLDGDARGAMEQATGDEPIGNALLLLFLIGYSLGPILLTIGLRIARRVGVWAPIAAVITAGANLLGGPIAGIVQLVALAVLWATIVVAVLRSPARPIGIGRATDASEASTGVSSRA